MIKKKIKSYDGLEITYFVHRNKGKRRFLVMLHGFAGNHTLCKHLFNHFKKKFNIIALDLRGHGKSGKTFDKASFALENFALDVKKVLLKEKVSKATFIGLSIGGIISFKCYEMFPHKIESLIIISSSYNFIKTIFKPLVFLERIFEKIKVSDPFFYRKKWFSRFIPDRAVYYPDFTTFDRKNLRKEYFKKATKSLDKDTLHSFVLIEKQMMKWDMKSVLPEIKVPCLFITGKKDLMTRPQAAYKMGSLVPKSIVEIVDDADHDMILTKPNVLNRKIKKFLEGVKK
jgi:pimeloyl-ACP methyl ester carboxylesterase